MLAQLHRSVPVLFLVSLVLFFFAYMFNILVPGLPPGTREGAILTVWFCLISGSIFLTLAIVLFPRWVRELFQKKAP